MATLILRTALGELADDQLYACEIDLDAEAAETLFRLAIALSGVAAKLPAKRLTFET